MAASGITVLKHNVPWGPFTRAQIDDGLARGDFTLQYLAHAPGLTEWLPLGEVLDHIARRESPASPALPPIPASRDLPPVPPASPAPPAPNPIPLVLPAAPPKTIEPAPPKPQSPPVVDVPPPRLAPAPAPHLAPAPDLETAPFFLRAVAFFVDFGILFLPLLLLFILGALSIWVPTWFRHESAQAVSEQWDLLMRNAKSMAASLAVGCGWLYAAWYESSAGQATIGKRWMGLRVVDDNGHRLSFLHATGRYAAKYLSALPCFLGFLMALFSSRGTALHDRLAGTRVVRN
jgi:uncharacterized RDD family membrane protein YckC